SQDAIVFTTQPGQARGKQREQIIEKPPPHVRIALNEREVFWCEQHGAQVTNNVSSPRNLGAVDARAVGFSGVYLHFQQSRAIPARQITADYRKFGALLDQGSTGGNAMARQGGEIYHRLDQIGFTLPVMTNERGKSGL